MQALDYIKSSSQSMLLASQLIKKKKRKTFWGPVVDQKPGDFSLSVSSLSDSQIVTDALKHVSVMLLGVTEPTQPDVRK